MLYRDLLDSHPQSRDLMAVVLSRAARSARMTAHHDLEFPRAPATADYQCHKHKRICHPTSEALKFLRRYSLDTVRRVKEYAAASIRCARVRASRRCPLGRLPRPAV